MALKSPMSVIKQMVEVVSEARHCCCCGMRESATVIQAERNPFSYEREPSCDLPPEVTEPGALRGRSAYLPEGWSQFGQRHEMALFCQSCAADVEAFVERRRQEKM